VLFCGCQHTDVPVTVIHLNQPQSELIFTILHEIGHWVLHSKYACPLQMPWYVNRPYENETVADIAYKAKRALRQKYGKEWQADLWALIAFQMVGTKDDIKAFLIQHPEKIPLFLMAVAALVIIRIGKFIRKLVHL